MLKIITSQLKVLPTSTDLCAYSLESALVLKNEPFSFQLAYSLDANRVPVSILVESELPIEVFRVDQLPIINAANECSEPGYVTSEPGLVPDLLMPRPAKPEIVRKGGLYFECGVESTLNACRSVRSLLVTVNPDSLELEPGEYRIACKMTNLENNTLTDECELTVKIVGASLPRQDFRVTNWFHVDCLCDTYGCEPYDERFYEIFETCARDMVRHRQNTILLPAFTPALDTPIGHARRNVQLVDITCDGVWHFDFTRLARFMRTASDCGIEYFEHCHLFSQWGAKKAPNIYDRDGKLLFGWDTDASGDEYRAFIRAYLSAFIDFLRSEGYSDDRLIFHISDEPSDVHLESYRTAYESVADLLAPFDHIDALSDVNFARCGLVKSPVAHIPEADKFAAECDRFWLYYTCGPYAKMASNRLITSTPARTRVLGAQMYRYKANGFLHWGYNYCYDRMSEGVFDPRIAPCGYKLLPGCSYIAYPGKDGMLPSLREIHMREAFDDLRALKLLESLTSREETLARLESIIGEVSAKTIPEANVMFDAHQAIVKLIAESVK